jgi:hypothetical protein
MNGDDIGLLLYILNVFDSLNTIQIGLWKIGQYVYDTLDFHSLLNVFIYIWFNCDPTFCIVIFELGFWF